jgi:hypothetical protein
MRMEIAITKLISAARQKDVTPERLARMFELTLEKVVGQNPSGEAAQKIVQTNMVKNLLRSELKVAVRVAKGPRKPRTVKAKGKATKPKVAKTPQEKADELIHKALFDPAPEASDTKVTRSKKVLEPAE